MKRIVSIVIAGLITSSLSIAQDKPAEKKPVFEGAKKCMICHKGDAKGNVHEKWLASKHANAFQTLVNKKDGSEKKPECLACHTTGYDKSGYKVGAENAALFEGVQCEACHGAGSDYRTIHGKDLAAAAKAGFVAKPTEATCKECHNDKSPTFDKDKPFKFEEMHKKIDHRYKAAKAGF